MEEKLLGKIKSKYIFHLIFSYIQDENYIYKTFKYSKFYQHKINLDYNNIKEYITIFDKYLLDNDEYNFNNDLKKFKLHNKKIEFYIINYFRNHPNKNIKGFNINEFSLDINILSPLFDVLLKEKFFENMFNIVIDLNEIKDNNNIDKTIEKYRTLSKMNLNHLSFKCIIGKKDNQEIKEQKDIKILNKIFINYDNIKKIEISFYDINLLYTNILLVNMANNLIYIKLEKLGYPKCIFLSYLLSNIINFKYLTYLEICNYIF